MAGADIILTRLCDLQGTNFEVVDCKVTDNEIVWRIEHKANAVYVCKSCGLEHTTCHDKKTIMLRDVPFGKKTCRWIVKFARILCSCKLQVRNEKLSFRATHHKLTQRFVDYIEQVLCSKMFTVADVARLFELDYSTAYKIDHEVLRRLVQELKIPDPINISVDEKSFQKGHSYVTVVTDCDIQKVIWVSEGNRKDSLDQFFQILGPERCAKIKTVSKNLHKAYALSCTEFIPQALQVADPFHVVKKLNEVMVDCRKELSVGSALAVGKRRIIQGLNWVMRYKQENLPEKHLESLEKLAEVNEPLFLAYLHLNRQISLELCERKTESIRRRIESAKFIRLQTVDQYDFDFNASTRAAKTTYLKIHRLATAGQIPHAVFVGSTGLGKTHLARALGYAVCQADQSVLFTKASVIVNQLAAAKATHNLDRELNKFCKPQLLIIDELGYVTMDVEASNLFFQVISDRHDRRLGTIVTTNFAFGHWNQIFASNSTAVVTVERLTAELNRF